MAYYKIVFPTHILLIPEVYNENSIFGECPNNEFDHYVEFEECGKELEAEVPNINVNVTNITIKTKIRNFIKNIFKK